jgi:hypothetical protein
MSTSNRSPMLPEIDSLPEMVGYLVDKLTRTVAAAVPARLCQEAGHLFLTGCDAALFSGAKLLEASGYPAAERRV